MTTWRKSSKSESAGQCVEVRSDLMALRDSKSEGGPELLVASFGELLRAVRTGRFDR